MVVTEFSGVDTNAGCGGRVLGTPRTRLLLGHRVLGVPRTRPRHIGSPQRIGLHPDAPGQRNLTELLIDNVKLGEYDPIGLPRRSLFGEVDLCSRSLFASATALRSSSCWWSLPSSRC